MIAMTFLILRSKRALGSFPQFLNLEKDRFERLRFDKTMHNSNPIEVTDHFQLLIIT